MGFSPLPASPKGEETQSDSLWELRIINYELKMMEIDNYSRFYALLHRMPYEGNRDDLKEVLVKTYTQCRTSSLRNMTQAEYDKMCRRLEDELGLTDEQQRWRDELRRHRSACLHLMQRIGVNTADWARVNDFCRHPRICGKEFGRLGTEELVALQRKLRAIENKLKN